MTPTEVKLKMKSLRKHSTGILTRRRTRGEKHTFITKIFDQNLNLSITKRIGKNQVYAIRR